MPALSIPAAIAALHAGGVVAYPTEAVWGLGCDPFDEAAVMRLLALKQRDVAKGLILVAGTLDAVESFLDWDALPTDRREAVFASWPGPHTWIVPAGGRVPHWITGAHDGVAVRISAHPLVASLCNAFGGPLVSTSANRAGDPPPRQLAQVEPALLGALDGWIDGDTGTLSAPTEIRDARSGAVLRAS